MWTKTHRKFYHGVSSKYVWQILIDINNWPNWHNDLSYCKLEGEFKVGNYFVLKPKNAPPVKILLTEINEGKSFTDCTNFFGAKMFDTHTIEEKEGGIILTNKLVVTGIFKWLWIKLVAQNIADTVLNEMDTLVNLAKDIDVNNNG
ncbi:MAG: hypothetical protein HRT87_02270 [Legionellales bacterium]|nr:hypothetical protein [Legionellales bacterium]